MDQQYKLRKDVDDLQIVVAQNSSDIEMLRAVPYSRYCTVVSVDDGTCVVREEDSDRLFFNVPVLNNSSVSVGSTVVVGFANNNILYPYIAGAGVDSSSGGGCDCGSVVKGFCDTFLGLYYIDEPDKLSLATLSTTGKACVLNSTLLLDGVAYPNRELKLYVGDTLVDTQVTDSDGVASFPVSPSLGEPTVYTVKYTDEVTSVVARSAEAIEETVDFYNLNDVECLSARTEYDTIKNCELILCQDNKLISKQYFDSNELRYYRGKASITKHLPYSRNWEVEFSVYTPNRALTEGCVLVRWSDAQNGLWDNDLRDCIAFRTNGIVDVYNHAREKRRITQISNGWVQWNYNRTHIKLTKNGTHYTATFTNIIDPTIFETVEFDSDVFDIPIVRSRGEIRAVLTTDCVNGDCNFHNMDIEFYDMSIKYNQCTVYNVNNLTLDSDRIVTRDSNATISGILTTNDVPSPNRVILLYKDNFFVDRVLTDNNGRFSFNVTVTDETNNYNVRYADDNTRVDCTVIYSTYTFPLDGTDTLISMRGTNTATNGVLTVGRTGQCYLKNYYLDNSDLWEMSYEYYATGGNWYMELLITNQTSNGYGITYGYQGGLTLGRINSGYSRYELGEDFVYQYNKWVKVNIKKTDTNTLQITIDDDVTTTITDNRVSVPSAFYFSIWSSSTLSIQIRNIILDPAIPNE